MSDIDTDVGYHPILYPILTPISVVPVPDIGYPEIGPDINTDNSLISGMQCTMSVTERPDIGVYPISVSISVSM